MSTHNPYAQAGAPGGYRRSGNPYQGQAVQTATPAQLVLMLYDGALTAIGRVRIASAEGTTQSLPIINRELQRAQAIINELQVSLDFAKGSPIAGYFASLYDFCQHELRAANISKVIDRLEDVESVLLELRDAWNQACVIGNPEAVTAASAEPALAAG